MPARRTLSISPIKARASDIDWNRVVMRAKEIVESHETSVTLRQLYYGLVSEGLISNDQNKYKTLSRKTAQARREGWFPALIDRTRAIERPNWWYSSKDALDEAQYNFRIDRTEGQPYSIYLGVEKHGMSIQLMHWFGKLGIPILALGGYSSQTFVDVVKSHVERQERPSVLLYAGDFDASGVDIDRDFEERTEIFDEVIRVALLRPHLQKYGLPPMPGKETDSRTAAFILQHGESIQVELDALPPTELRKLYQRKIDKFWDKKAFMKAIEREAVEQDKLDTVVGYAEEKPATIAMQIVEELDADGALDVYDAAYERFHQLNYGG